MKKHLLGLAIFSFIVVSFVVSFGFIYATKVGKVEEIKKPVIENDTRRKCDFWEKTNKDSSFSITQATLQRNSREFNAFINGGSFHSHTSIKLHFFLDDGEKPKYMGTQDSQVRGINIEGKSKLGLSADLRGMLKTYDRKSNFYVMPELITLKNKFDTNQVEFDASKSVSILWVD
ncbi:MAG TPA: hypothetical protein PKE69_13700 [Pyrinomonadaceae bacterium]|nr:hypothetical protein [Pyrinomonadaceae bacterium]